MYLQIDMHMPTSLLCTQAGGKKEVRLLYPEPKSRVNCLFDL